MAKLRWGILATGWIADLFVQDLLDNEIEVTAVGSRSIEKAVAFATKHGIPRSHGSYEALAADPEVDVVYIATPHPFHASAAELCIAEGKHVLIEKSFTLTGAEARHLLQLSRKHDVVVLEAMWTRFLPHMVRLREALASGMIGEIRTLLATHTQDLPDDPNHRLNALELGGGALLDLGIYPISFAFDILGQPSEVLASGRLKSTGADAEVSTLFRYANGASALTVSASDAPGSNRAEINGTEGHVEIDGVWYTPTSFRIYDSQKNLLEEFKPAEMKGRGMHFQAVELERLVAAGERTSPILPLEQSVAIMETLDAIRKQIGVIYPSEANKSG
ncbi:Gfo/Idh/MocA family protein [Pleomorphomonas sp. PLEO]|uniref:Gfo/Idh/MocA family protein n=1 Tax=Pleomorphomonas sp. PLEO TaxID=3239306 RepID=UPI00351E3738